MRMLLSKLQFGSLLSYTPRPTTDEQRRAKNAMYAIKSERRFAQPPETMSERIARVIASSLAAMPFSDFFGPDVTLVPIPRSTLLQPGTLWVPSNLAIALQREKLGKVFACLKRIEPVPKAATSTAEDRPKASDHYRTLQVEAGLFLPNRIVLIDDVITRGATLLGAASRLLEAFPGVHVRAFAAMRTMSNPNEFRRLDDPCVGEIALRGQETLRRP